MFSNVIDLLFNCTCFIYIGMVIPFSEWSNVHTSVSRESGGLLPVCMSRLLLIRSRLLFCQISVWRLFCLAIAILLLRRLPFMLAFYKWIPDIRTFREAAFTGWFGPMGVGAVFIATLAKTKLPEPQEEPIGQAEILSASIQPIVYFLVLISILCRECCSSGFRNQAGYSPMHGPGLQTVSRSPSSHSPSEFTRFLVPGRGSPWATNPLGPRMLDELIRGNPFVSIEMTTIGKTLPMMGPPIEVVA